MKRPVCFATSLFLLSLTAFGCDKPEALQPSTQKSASKAASALAVGSIASASGKVHRDPAHPPIDCPLRKAGVDPHNLTPFEDTQKYIAFLEREDRAVWQKPDTLVDSLELSGSEVVADLGTGSGYFAFRFAKSLPKGKVVAIDVEPEMVRHVHHKAMTSGVENVEVVIAKPDDPSIPKGVDMVFVCDVLHHVEDRPGWLKKLSGQIGEKTKVVLVEFKEGSLPQGPPSSLKIDKNKIVALMKGAGLDLREEKKNLLPYQYVLIFSKSDELKG